KNGWLQRIQIDDGAAIPSNPLACHHFNHKVSNHCCLNMTSIAMTCDTSIQVYDALLLNIDKCLVIY
ncbi:unnamed protein product, partial [Musa banksii]